MAEKLTTQCCIVGGGPAGMMLGLMVARAGVSVVVLEKHADCLRDFRGDTHPSTLEAMHELGLLDDLLKFPHQKASQINGASAGLAVTVADFSHLPVRCPYIAFMPQWATTRPACISISSFAFLARTPTTRPSCLISPMVALVQFSGAFRPDSSESRAAGTCADSKTARLTRSIGWATV
jgi:hypothetical protein